MADPDICNEHCILTDEQRKNRIPVVPVIILGILVLSLGIHCINYDCHLFDEDFDAVGVFLIIMSFLMMIFSFVSLRNCVLTEGVMFMLSGLIGIVIGLILVVPNATVVPSILLLMIGLIVSGAIFYSRKEYVMAVSSIGFAIAIITTITGSQFASGAILSAIGIMLVVMGSFSMIGVRTNLTLHESTVAKIEKEEYPEVFVMTAGTLIFANLSFLIGVTIADPSGSGMSYLFMKLLLGSMTLAFGMYALTNKIVGEGALMTIIGLSSLIGAICVGTVGHSPHILDILFGLMLIPVNVCMMYKKEYLVGITTLLLATVLILEPFWESASSIEYLVAVAKILAMYYAISSWYQYDTGKNLRFLAKIKKTEEGSDE